MKKIGDFIANILGRIIIDLMWSSVSPWQRVKWKIEDFFKRK